jgi:2-polyprenyl-6-methoxyphenol hydroxylase-like FAD-dependent oxidoreductase
VRPFPLADRFVSSDRAFDTVIIGGGISGTLAATALGRAGYRVCIIDLHAVYPRDFQAEHLDGAMIELLRRLDFLDKLTTNLFRGETVTFARSGRVVGTTGTINFGLRYEELVNRARAALPPNVCSMVGRVCNIETSERLQHVILSDGQVVTARLIILATGQGAALARQAGAQRETLREGHSLTFGFDIESTGPTSFKDSFIVYERENIQDRIDYLAAFTMHGRTRVNLFTYRDYKEPWTRAFLADPDAELRKVLPGLGSAIGAYRALGPVEARPIDLYVTKNAVQNGVVLIGDAFQSSCPATGTGILRLLTDIEQLCWVYLPRWLQTPEMDASKIGAFYADPIKQACDAKALHDSSYRRAVSTETSLRWRLHRARLTVVEHARAALHRRPAPDHPRVAEQTTSASLVPG